MRILDYLFRIIFACWMLFVAFEFFSMVGQMQTVRTEPYGWLDIVFAFSTVTATAILGYIAGKESEQ